jgi:hypothetical protein
MSDQQIGVIEKKLGINLPRHYISFLLDFEGIKHLELDLGNFLYNTPDEVVNMNQVVGFYANSNTIKNKLVVGDNGGGDFYLIDLLNPNDKKVYVFDHEESFENNFDRVTNSWNWAGFEYYNSLKSYKKKLEEIFGLE